MCMGRNKVNDKIVSITVQLRTSQIEWIKLHPEVRINKFFRDQLNKFIEVTNRIEQL